jgi:hypothetical protein
MAKHEREAERRVAEGRPRFAEDVKAGMNRLGGKSRSDLEPDHRLRPRQRLGRMTAAENDEVIGISDDVSTERLARGAASPLGHGMGAKKVKERGR